MEDLEGQHIPNGVDLFKHLIKTAYRNELNPGMVLTFVTLSAESITDGNPGREYFLQRYSNLRNEITDAFIAVAKEEKTTININDAFMASSAILAVMDGLQFQWLLDRKNVKLADYTEYAITAIVRSVIPLNGKSSTL